MRKGKPNHHKHHGPGRHHGHRHGRGPRHGGRGRLFAPGEYRFAMLGLLAEGPAHGYELMKRLEEKTEGRYTPSAGATYPVLQQLQDEGLATAESAHGKKVYSLTRDGEAEAAASADDLAAMWERAAKWRRWSSLDAPELADFRELRALIRTVTERVVDEPADEETRDRIRAIIATAADDVRNA